jgi:hypothetical protein
MLRIALAIAVFSLVPETGALAQTCNTLGGSAPGCGTKKGAQAGPAGSQNTLRGRNDIKFTPDMSGLVGRTSQEDDQPKASLGGLTTDSDGRQCLQIGLSITCSKGPAR